MISSLKINNCLIYNSEVEFSMRANMHYRRFPNAVASIGNNNILKTAILFGPNNSGKTNLIQTIATIKQIMLNQNPNIMSNLFTDDSICEMAITFFEGENEYAFEVKYDTSKEEYVFERFAQISRDSYNNISEDTILLRDILHAEYDCKDETLLPMMKLAAKNNILIYLMDTDQLSILKQIKETIVAFASKIDIVDMNNIPIRKTLEMLKNSNEKKKERIVNFILNADLSLDDFKYLSDDEMTVTMTKKATLNGDMQPQETALNLPDTLMEMLHLTSVYKGICVPSLLFDSTGTKKIASIASYVIDALENGRILIVDELDNSLHFKLTRAILALFNNELNKNAQLIATAHDISLLDCRTLFRKEQIWFSYKDRNHAYLYSLAEFTADKDGIRDTSDLIEKYRSGVFGALPEPDLFLSLLEVRENV